MVNSFYDISLLILGQLPNQFAFLNAIFAFILAIVFLFIILTPFIFIWKLCYRW